VIGGRWWTRRRPVTTLAVVLLLLLTLAVSPIVFAYSGIYDVAATRQHTPAVYWVLITTLRQSITRHAAREAPAPPADLGDAGRVALGRMLFDEHCAACHGAPGIAPRAMGLGLTPAPPNLVTRSRDLAERDLFWVIANGIKMTGMPSWRYVFNDHEIWSLVTFLKVMPTLAPVEYAPAGTPQGEHPAVTAPQVTMAMLKSRGDAARGRTALRQYACHTCHEIPGVTGADAITGPSLRALGRRMYLAGGLLNTPDNLVQFVRAPRIVEPRTAMPDLAVSEQDAIDMAAYLYTLR
jgi:cytochrome c1